MVRITREMAPLCRLECSIIGRMPSSKRKVILACGISLDGYIARPDGSLDFLDIGMQPEDFEQAAADFYKGIDTVVMGSGTLAALEKMVTDGALTELPVGPHDTYVFSRSRPKAQHKAVTIVRESPVRWLNRIRSKPGKNILHQGGGALARSFLEADLIDELQLGIVPVLIGAGIPLFPAGFPQREFELVKVERFSTHHVSMHYRRVRTKEKRPRKRAASKK